MPTAPTRKSPTTPSVPSLGTRKTPATPSTPSLGTRKSPATPSTPSQGARLSPAVSVVVPGVGIEFEGAANILTIGAGALFYGIRVGHFVSGTNIQPGTRVTAVNGQEVAIDLGTDDTSDATSITFSSVPPPPTRKS